MSSSRNSSTVESTKSDGQHGTLPSQHEGCFLCGQASNRVVLREGQYEGRLCECDLIYTHPRPLHVWDDFLIDHHADEFYAEAAKRKVAWTLKHCEGERLLEIGCGMGDYLLAARKAGFDVMGMEPNVKRAAYVREELGIPVREEFLETNQLRERFDVVYHCDLLSHFPDPLQALTKMTELLKPGGRLCFEVGTLAGISPFWYRWIGGVGLHTHIWLYSARSLQTLFDRAQLRVVASRRYGLAPSIVVPRMLEAVSLAVKRIACAPARMTKSNAVDSLKVKPPEGSQSATGARSTRQELLDGLRRVLRYRLGRLTPNFGPQTYLFVVEPMTPRS